MKKRIALILALVLVCALLAACGSTDELSNTSWVLSEISTTDGTLDANALKENNIQLDLDFKAGGKVSVTDAETTESATYTLDGDKITMKDSKDTLSGTFSESKITLSTTDGDMIFVKK